MVLSTLEKKVQAENASTLADWMLFEDVLNHEHADYHEYNKIVEQVLALETSYPHCEVKHLVMLHDRMAKFDCCSRSVFSDKKQCDECLSCVSNIKTFLRRIIESNEE